MTDNANISKTDKPFKCLHCEKQFSRKSNLKRHAKKEHPNKEEEKKKYRYPCKMCKRNFSKRNHLLFHKRQKHGDPASVLNVPYKCFHCRQEFKKSLLLTHYQDDHSYNLNKIEWNLPSFESFIAWKDNEEQTTCNKFISERGVRVTGRTKHHYYTCHRSGKSEPTNKLSGHLKFISSNKTGYFCPAKIDVVELEDKSCSIKYINCHIGHSVSSNQESLSEGISKKSSFNVLLDEIRDSFYGSDHQRIHLLSENYLYMIHKIFDMDSNEICQENYLTVWIEEIISDEQVSVIFYKPQGVLSDQYSVLKAEDFVLIIMNDLQKELIMKYGPKCICVDVIKNAIKVNSCKLQLVTLLIIDDDDECFPCALLISNKLDQHVASVFFSSIKAKTGILKSEAFMSDTTDTFFNSWWQVMGQPEKRLFSSWHIDKIWRKNLTKMKNKEKQAETYNILCDLLHESDRDSFHLKLSEFKKLNEDSDTLGFATYFEEYFSNNYELWAYCYRLHNGLNASISIERMHHTIKYIYMLGQPRKRVDKVINALMVFIRDKVIRKISPLFERKLSSNLRFIKDGHQASYYISAEIKHENGWLISSDGCVVCYILKNDIQCNCNLICRDCKICIHKYSCSCIDSSVRWLMCKHMHFLSRKINGFTLSFSDLYSGDSLTSFSLSPLRLESENHNLSREINCETESDAVFVNTLQTNGDESIGSLSDLCLNSSSESFSNEQLENTKNHMIEMIKSVSTKEECEVLEKSFVSIEPLLLGCHPNIVKFQELQSSMPNTQTAEIP